MKRLLITWVAITLLIYPSVCIASHFVQLKNGKKFLISEYWEEGSQVKFYYYGGLVSIEKDLISTIKESDVPYIEVQPAPVEKPEPEAAPAQAEAEAEEETEKAVPEEKEKEAKKLLEEFDLLKKDFEMSRHFMTYDELFKFAEDLIGLRKRFMKERLYRFYPDKLDEMRALQQEAMAMLIKQSQ